MIAGLVLSLLLLAVTTNWHRPNAALSVFTMFKRARLDCLTGLNQSKFEGQLMLLRFRALLF